MSIANGIKATLTILILMLCCCSPNDQLSFPDVYIITIDTLRQDHLGCYGHPSPVSPFIDRLSMHNITFANGMCAATYTNPSHSSIFTGTYPTMHGVRDNFNPMSEKPVLLAEIMKKHGFLTAAFVSGAPLGSKICGLDRGFMTYNDDLNEKKMKLSPCSSASVSNKKNGYRVSDVLKPLYQCNIRKGVNTFKAVKQWINSGQKDIPVFVWIHFYDIHGPYSPPTPFNKMYYQSRNPCDPKLKTTQNAFIPPYQKIESITDINWYRAMYNGEIRYVDQCVSKLFNEIIFFRQRPYFAVLTSDHGEDLGEHNSYFDHGANVYESSLSVPLMFCMNRSVDSPRIQNNFSHGIDIFPTILHHLNISGYKSDGVCLLEDREGIAQVNQRVLFSETKPNFPGQKTKRLYCSRKSSFKYIFRDNPEESELYDMAEDGQERKNLVKQLSKMSQDMRSMFIDSYLISSIGDDREETTGEIDLNDRESMKALGYIE